MPVAVGLDVATVISHPSRRWYGQQEAISTWGWDSGEANEWTSWGRMGCYCILLYPISGTCLSHARACMHPLYLPACLLTYPVYLFYLCFSILSHHKKLSAFMNFETWVSPSSLQITPFQFICLRYLLHDWMLPLPKEGGLGWGGGETVRECKQQAS